MGDEVVICIVSQLNHAMKPSDNPTRPHEGPLITLGGHYSERVVGGLLWPWGNVGRRPRFLRVTSTAV